MNKLAARSTFATKLLLGGLIAVGFYLSVSGLAVPVKAQLAQHLLERSWDKAQRYRAQKAAKPRPWADTHPVARLTFNRIRWSALVLLETRAHALAIGPGRL
ncbi:MAG: hypothetical protein ACU84Q_01230 [Gammaproteobacteria bacterium]